MLRQKTLRLAHMLVNYFAGELKWQEVIEEMERIVEYAKKNTDYESIATEYENVR